LASSRFPDYRPFQTTGGFLLVAPRLAAYACFRSLGLNIAPDAPGKLNQGEPAGSRVAVAEPGTLSQGPQKLDVVSRCVCDLNRAY